MLVTLFITCFLAATLLPFPSEVAYVAYLLAQPDEVVLATAVATAGNTLGGMTTYGLGRVLKPRELSQRALVLVERYGVLALLLSWLPIIGDAICGVAGWLRINAASALVLMAIGKAARYAAVAHLTL